LMGRLEEGLVNKEGTIKWCLMRQETGFNGRACKPVDTCYSFWIGGAIEVGANAYSFFFCLHTF